MSSIVDVVERIALVIGYSVCHQMPERSIFVGGRQLPVCARDTGIFIGFAVTVLLANAFLKKKSFQSRKSRLLLSLLILPALLDAATSYAHLRDTNNATRLFTGVLAGAGLAFLVWSYYPGIRRLERNEPVPGATHDKSTAFFALFISQLFLSFLVTWSDISFLVLTLLSVASILLTIVFLNSSLVLLLNSNWLKSRNAMSPGMVVVISFFMTICELVISNRLHYLVERALG